MTGNTKDFIIKVELYIGTIDVPIAFLVSLVANFFNISINYLECLLLFQVIFLIFILKVLFKVKNQQVIFLPFRYS